MLYDKTRDKPVIETPEELVRQNLVNFLIEKLGVPSHLIKTEFALSQLNKSEKGRLDIIVANPKKTDLSEPWLIAECKAGKTNLQNLEAQVNKYLRIVRPDNIILAIGNEWHFLSKTATGYSTVKDSHLLQLFSFSLSNFPNNKENADERKEAINSISTA